MDDLSVDVSMKEVHKFVLISGEGEDGTERQADGAAEVAPIAVEYKARQVASDNERENTEGHRNYVEVVTAWQKAIVIQLHS